jgi:hypothetical protein
LRTWDACRGNCERLGTIPNKPKQPPQPNAEKYPAEPGKAEREQAAEQAKVRDMVRRPMKKGKLTKGSRRRI